MEGQPRRGADLRALKALVAGLGVLIVLGTALVVGVIIHRMYAPPVAASMPVRVVGAAVPANLAPLLLPAGDHIAGMAAAGDAVAIWVTGPEGGRVLILNPTTGAWRKLVVAQDGKGGLN